ncbi:hypothetical protein NEHOM01_0588 [Nematocida homosporus]|uniref:uncharacterized protein n=1 Tax=Nematocida homosporus TaxID=1912981 RepID=UPI0022207AB3|nr:uncharacterized protein NEHOM01_0588 [Nematocida homosporus]KAI5185083.1 hypothetical protein NEHOM01_0588 [Nematocida homosporus]
MTHRSTKHYPAQGITITILSRDPFPEQSPQVNDILASGSPGYYTVDQTSTPPRVAYSTQPPSESLFLPPEHFQPPPDPNDPFRKFDPDNDHLPPPGNPSYFI